MKLRIRGDSIRMRLTRPEVEALGRRGFVEEATNFPGGARLVYRIEASDIAAPDAALEGATLRVRIPRIFAQQGASSAEIGLEARLPLPGGAALRLLIEKDFECLDPAVRESQEGAYPNPLGPDGCHRAE